jgi:hypothetical protein
MPEKFFEIIAASEPGTTRGVVSRRRAFVAIGNALG